MMRPVGQVEGRVASADTSASASPGQARGRLAHRPLKAADRFCTNAAMPSF
jgi:hypothetical protein